MHLHRRTLQHSDKSGVFKSVCRQPPTAVYLGALGTVLTYVFLQKKIHHEIYHSGVAECQSSPTFTFIATVKHQALLSAVLLHSTPFSITKDRSQHDKGQSLLQRVA